MIVPACFTDLIGIEPCVGESTFLRHLGELPGLSITSIAATMPTEKWTGARACIEDLVPLGIDDVLFFIKTQMAANGLQLLKKVDAGRFCLFGTTTSSFAAGDGGVQVQKNWVLQPEAQPIRVETIWLKSPNLTNNVPVKIKDEAGTVLWEQTVPILAADTEHAITVGVDFYTSLIKVVVEGTAMQGYYASCTTGTACCGQPPLSNPQSSQRSAFYVNAIEAGTTGGFKSPGISVAVSMPCNDGLLCQYGEQLASAFVYAVGVRILKEWEASTRLNVFSLKKEWVKETLPEWENIWQEKAHMVLPFVSSDLLSCFPRCIKCNQPVGTMPALP